MENACGKKYNHGNPWLTRSEVLLYYRISEMRKNLSQNYPIKYHKLSTQTPETWYFRG